MNYGFGIGIFYRRYFNIKPEFSLFLQPTSSFNYNTRITIYDGNSTDNNIIASNTSLGVGLAYNINKRIRLITYLGNISYMYTKSIGFSGSSYNFNTNFGISYITYGLEVKF